MGEYLNINPAYQLTEAMKASIAIAEEDVCKGRIVDHDQLMKEMEEWLTSRSGTKTS